MKNEHYVDYETGEVVPIVSKSKTPSKEVIALVSLFETLAEKATGVKPDMTKAYFKLIRSMKQYSLSPEDVKKLYQYFFKDPKLSVEKKVSIGLCISGAYITQWKVSQKNKAVSQVDASSEIYLWKTQSKKQSSPVSFTVAPNLLQWQASFNRLTSKPTALMPR